MLTYPLPFYLLHLTNTRALWCDWQTVQYLWRAGPVCPRESRGWEWSETRTSQTLGTDCGLAHTDALHSDTQTISYVMTVEFSLECQLASHFYKQLILICYKSSHLGSVSKVIWFCLSDRIKWIEIEWIEHESLPPPTISMHLVLSDRQNPDR